MDISGLTNEIIDTGTSILLMRQDVVEAYYSQVPGARMDSQQGGFVYPCDVNLPDFGIMITESYTAKIEGKLMTFNNMGKCKSFVSSVR